MKTVLLSLLLCLAALSHAAEPDTASIQGSKTRLEFNYNTGYQGKPERCFLRLKTHDTTVRPIERISLTLNMANWKSHPSVKKEKLTETMYRTGKDISDADAKRLSEVRGDVINFRYDSPENVHPAPVEFTFGLAGQPPLQADPTFESVAGTATGPVDSAPVAAIARAVAAGEKVYITLRYANENEPRVYVAAATLPQKERKQLNTCLDAALKETR